MTDTADSVQSGVCSTVWAAVIKFKYGKMTLNNFSITEILKYAFQEKKYRLIVVWDLCNFSLITNTFCFSSECSFYSSRFRFWLRSAFGCRKLIREVLHGPEVWIYRLQFNSCISLCCQEGAFVRDAVWSLLHYNLVLWLRKTGPFVYSKKPPTPNP